MRPKRCTKRRTSFIPPYASTGQWCINTHKTHCIVQHRRADTSRESTTQIQVCGASQVGQYSSWDSLQTMSSLFLLTLKRTTCWHNNINVLMIPYQTWWHGSTHTLSDAHPSSNIDLASTAGWECCIARCMLAKRNDITYMWKDLCICGIVSVCHISS